jgi:histidine ammonia-lyase
VSHDQPPAEAEIDDVTSQLSEAMRTCQAMVANYRTMIAGEANMTEPDAEIETATTGAEQQPPSE